MATTNATILIPDISGFTEFMTTTELSHGSQAINMLIDAIVKSIDDEYEVAEIEGDAVLLIRKGAAPSRKDIISTCMKIFNGFHGQRMWIQQHSVCPCGACQCIVNLTLKFVVHHGPLAEIKVGRFVKQSGLAMIVAHRLLKNSIGSNEYLLVTEDLLQEAADSTEPVDMEWANSSEEYGSIGKVDYRFTLLHEIRKNIPQPSATQDDYSTDSTPYLEVPIAANFRDVYMVLMNIPGRVGWMPGLQEVRQDIPAVFVGSIHHCRFEHYQAIVSPLRMALSDDGIEYAESCRIAETNVSVIYEYVFKKIAEKECSFAIRCINAGESPIPEQMSAALSEQTQLVAERLKAYCETMEVSFFEPAFQ